MTSWKLFIQTGWHPDPGDGDVSLVKKHKSILMRKSLFEWLKMLKADFDDFLSQMRQMKKLGSMGSIAQMLPGMGKVQVGDKEEAALGRHEAIILSMTKQERKIPRIIGGSRRKRIADGAGVQIRDVNLLIKQFSQMQKMMRKMKGGKMKQLMNAFKGEDYLTKEWIRNNYQTGSNSGNMVHCLIYLLKRENTVNFFFILFSRLNLYSTVQIKPIWSGIQNGLL